jgi:hypothetical protein
MEVSGHHFPAPLPRVKTPVHIEQKLDGVQNQPERSDKLKISCPHGIRTQELSASKLGNMCGIKKTINKKLYTVLS